MWADCGLDGRQLCTRIGERATGGTRTSKIPLQKRKVQSHILGCIIKILGSILSNIILFLYLGSEWHLEHCVQSGAPQKPGNKKPGTSCCWLEQGLHQMTPRGPFQTILLHDCMTVDAGKLWQVPEGASHKSCQVWS